jgi:hypothetical protein
MDVKMGVTGIEEVYAALRNEAERVSSTARKTMHRGADQIVKEARLNAPRDTGDLEEAIHKDVSYGERNRLQIDIVMDEVDYGTEMHEHYPEDRPGPGTLAKRAANPGRHVGGKFITRAVEFVAPKLIKDMIGAIVRKITL